MTTTLKQINTDMTILIILWLTWLSCWGYQYLQVAKDIDMQEREVIRKAIQKMRKSGNHDLQPVSVVLKQSIKAHIL
jgi:hypothetical protein